MIKFLTQKKGNLKVLHVGDAHIGRVYSDMNKLDKDNKLNLMINDELNALREVKKAAIENDVAAVIFPGDFYDHVSGISQTLLYYTKEEILDMARHDIVVVILSGNHDTPKTEEYKALISLFDGFQQYVNIAVLYEGKYEKVDINGEILIHNLPWTNSKEKFLDEYGKIKKDDNYKVNVFTTHVGLGGAGIKKYSYSEPWLDAAEINNNFDYIALGDYHDVLQVSDKAWYAGALVNNKFDEKDCKHAFLLYDKNTDTVSQIPYYVRPMTEYKIECCGKDLKEIEKEIENIKNTADFSNFIKIKFNEITKKQQSEMSRVNLQKIKKEAFYCKVEYSVLKEETAEITTTEIKSVKEELFETIDSHSSYDTNQKNVLKNLYLKIDALENQNAI